MTRLPEFSNAEQEYHESLLRFDPQALSDDLDFISEAIVADITFEPFVDNGDAQRLFNAAVNLFHYVEELEKRTGSLELPIESSH
jgi:hypothetical protein